MADQPGDYPGLSAQFSGDGFSDMRFVVHALPQAQFSSWLAHAQTEGNALDADAYAQLARAGHGAATTYRGVDPMLFEHIVQRTAQP